MRIGCARVSTDDRTPDLQKDVLKLAKRRETYGEHATGKHTGRPQLKACLKSLHDGDILVAWRLDQLGRNLAGLATLIALLESMKINFEPLTERIEAVSSAGRLVFHAFAELAEFERNLIWEGTVAGLKAARARARTEGHPSKVCPKKIKTVLALLKPVDVPVAEVRARFGVARSTPYRTVLQAVP